MKCMSWKKFLKRKNRIVCYKLESLIIIYENAITTGLKPPLFCAIGHPKSKSLKDKPLIIKGDILGRSPCAQNSSTSIIQLLMCTKQHRASCMLRLRVAASAEQGLQVIQPHCMSDKKQHRASAWWLMRTTTTCL